MNKPKDADRDRDQPIVACADRKTLTFGSLFAGIGGLDLGFERAGMECKWQVEINEHARQVLAKHWPNVRRHDDVRTWPKRDTEYVDIIAGGFPCQDISYAGKGAGLAGERSGLFYEAVRIIREVGPRIVVLENVAALLTRGMGDVLGTLVSIGFDCEWHCIPASAVGAPHRRDRVFVLGWNANGIKHGEKQGVCSGEAADTSGSGGNVADTERSAVQQRHVFDVLGRRSIEAEQTRLGSCESRGNQWGTEPGVGRVADGVPQRLDRLRGLGNAVVPQVAEWIGRRIVEAESRVN